MHSSEVRKKFTDFFSSKGHQIVESSSVLPLDDQTLLFTNSGMNQFKDIFIENSKSSFKRIVNSQKCIRVSGKHNDLEEVGIDTVSYTHLTLPTKRIV